MPEEPKPRERRLAWRPLVRSLHRDAGYLAVGLTLVYAISGIAVNHLADWDPNFQNFRGVHEVGKPLPGDTDTAVRTVLDRLGVRSTPTQVHRWAPDQLEIVVGERRINANPETGRIVEEGRKPRFFVRVANWLHLNRGKKAWTLFADLYAAGLLLLAISGIFMLPGKNGIRGRGAVFVTLGIAIPLLYVIFTGGPEAESGRSSPAPRAPGGSSNAP
ncbi:MAG: uncharacterized protein K0Q72_2529 [Armatimonadetes bacterium]|jgi:hypothetical protein|nr:uncharacterized protein [Armatimonadota bacterium]